MIAKLCKKCSKEFQVQKYRVETAKYCSRSCSTASTKNATGHKMSISHKEKLSNLNKGNKYCLGQRWNLSEETKEKMGEARKRLGTKPPIMRTTNYRLWLENPSLYDSIHAWVRRHFGRPMQCEECAVTNDNPRMIHWANISGEYRKDREDWHRLCAGCHKRSHLSTLIPQL